MELFDRSTSLFNNSSRKAKSFCPGCFVQTRIAGYNGPQQSQEMSAKQFTRKRNLHKFLPDKSTRFRGSVRHSLCCDRTTECCLLQACCSTGCEAPRSHHSESIKQFWHLSRSTRMQFTTSQQLSTITERRHQPSGREIEHDRKANSGANSPRLRRWKDTNCACQSELRSFLWFCTLKNKHSQFKKTIYVPSFHEGFSQAKQSWNLPRARDEQFMIGLFWILTSFDWLIVATLQGRHSPVSHILPRPAPTKIWPWTAWLLHDYYLSDLKLDFTEHLDNFNWNVTCNTAFKLRYHSNLPIFVFWSRMKAERCFRLKIIKIFILRHG